MRPNFQSQLSPLPPKMYSAPVIPDDVACYRILKPCFLDDVMYFEGDIVSWTEEPNSEMEPLNKLAKKASEEFYDKCERLGQEAAKLRGTKYISARRPEAREANTAEKRRVEIIKGDGGVPIMGARRGPGRPPKAAKLEVGALESKPVLGANKADT